ncbi:MAG: DNA cytosine methyltransferase [Lachnospiraceae bacterium]
MNVVSLFSGIGGLDQGFIDAGYDVIWANDFDQYAAHTYDKNNPEGIMHLGDINEIALEDIPAHDILIGGFPCQPFSMMGEQKGFEDTRGTLFFRIAEIINYQVEHNRAPRVIVLENVRRLLTHDKKNTFATIKRVLEELGYKVFHAVLNSADYGVPQIRNRLFIVCFRNQDIDFEYPEAQNLQMSMHDILDRKVDEKFYLSERVKPTILSDGTGGYVAKSEINQSPARPLCATMAKMHRACQDNYYSDDYILGNGDTEHIRKLTPRECARLQGFSDDFVIDVSNAQAYKQFGNAVTVNVSRAVATQIREKLEQIGEWH